MPADTPIRTPGEMLLAKLNADALRDLWPDDDAAADKRPWPVTFTMREAKALVEWAVAEWARSRIAPEASPPAAVSDTERGLYRKYRIERLDGSSEPGGKHEHCDYLVLDLVHDKHAAAALHAYANSCAAAYPVLAADLRARLAPPEPAQQHGELLHRMRENCFPTPDGRETMVVPLNLFDHIRAALSAAAPPAAAGGVDVEDVKRALRKAFGEQHELPPNPDVALQLAISAVNGAFLASAPQEKP